MKTPVILLVLLSLCAVVPYGCDDSGDEYIPSTLELTEEDNGSTIEINVAEQIKIDLQSNPPAGYNWSYIPVEISILELVSSAFTEHPGCAGYSGCNGIQTFNFKGIRPGEETIQLVYQRYFVEAPEEEFEVTVIVN